VRSEGLTRDLAGEEVEHIFALSFALEETHRHLADLGRCAVDLARRH